MLTASVFANFNGGTVVMIVLAILIAIYLFHLEKKQKSDPLAALYQQYATLTADTLNETADEELVRAVAVNVMNRTDRRRPDVYALIPTLSHGQVAVYSIWLLTNELAATDLAALLATPSGRFAEPAMDGLELVGAAQCAAALKAAVDSPEDVALTEALREALDAERPLDLCVAYIRENPDEFTDSKGNV